MLAGNFYGVAQLGPSKYRFIISPPCETGEGSRLSISCPKKQVKWTTFVKLFNSLLLYTHLSKNVTLYKFTISREVGEVGGQPGFTNFKSNCNLAIQVAGHWILLLWSEYTLYDRSLEQLIQINKENQGETKEIKQIKDNISTLSLQLDEANKKQHDETNKKISTLSLQLDEANKKIGTFSIELDEANKKISTLSLQLAETNKKMGSILEIKQNKATELATIFSISALLTNVNHQKVLREWVGKYTQWRLLYRGSVNGFSCQNFHSCCNNQGPTLTVVKSINNYLFGGYTPIPWKSSGSYAYSSHSFLFTLVNPHNSPPTKILHKHDNVSHSTYDNPSYGPTFGSGHDLHISNDCNGNDGSYCNIGNQTYIDTIGKGDQTFTGARNFRVSDLEVFGLR